MARLKTGTELDTLRRQQIELVKRIKEAEAKARLKEKVETERRERLAGRAVLAHLATDPHGAAAEAVRTILETASFRAADQSLFTAILRRSEGTTAGDVKDVAAVN